MWVLEELGLAYEQHGVDKADGTGRSPEYLAINPSGKVPMLVDDDVSVTESYAINLYLARQYGAGGFGPRIAPARLWRCNGRPGLAIEPVVSASIDAGEKRFSSTRVQLRSAPDAEKIMAQILAQLASNPG
jgi:glutathione S-transferase